MIEEVKNTPVSKETISDIKDALGEMTGMEDVFEAVAVLLAVDDEKFELMAPAVLDSYLRSLNTTNARLMVAQAINATGRRAEDIQENFMQLCNEID